MDALNGGAHPRVRLLGSAGMADLAPLADLADELFADVELAPKEALALVNNNSYSTALCALAMADARALARLDDGRPRRSTSRRSPANLTILDPVAESAPTPGSRTELNACGRALDGSYLWAPGRGAQPPGPALLPRVVQVHGAARDALAFALGPARDRAERPPRQPTRRDGEDRIVSAGCYDVLPLAAALDFCGSRSPRR